MSEITQPTLFHKLRHTPMRDLLRLRLSSRLDWKSSIDRAEIPAPAKALIHRVIRKTRLWRTEKADVATELVSHFSDGIESGESFEELIRRFGDERNSARLIRRGKKRARPLAWHAFNYLGWMFAGLLILYVGLAIYFVMGRPSVKVNYIAVLNEKMEKTSVSDRAWPHYRQALLATPWRERDDSLRNAVARGPGGKNWYAARDWLEANQPILAHIREGASKRVLGFRLGSDGDAYDTQLYPERCKPARGDGPLDGAMLSNLVLPHLSELRSLAQVLGADAAVAREKSDAKRFMGNIEAILSVASQCREDGTLISCLVGTGTRAMALHHVELALLETPGMLDESELRTLAHRLTIPRVAADLMTFDTERMFFYDIVQRMYTDDGDGDGRLTLNGMRSFPAITSPEKSAEFDAGVVALGPAAMLAMASRRELIEEYDRLIEEHEASLHRLPWQATWDHAEARIIEIKSSMRLNMKYALLGILMPALSSVQANAERIIAREDALAAAIALELYHRREGKYPAKLDELVPALLPSLPVDRITGQPLHYLLRDGKPVLYSVGADRDDDQGKIAYRASGKLDRNVSRWNETTHPVDGDWLLFPEPRDLPDDDD
jgi:hypothetical protein